MGCKIFILGGGEHAPRPYNLSKLMSTITSSANEKSCMKHRNYYYSPYPRNMVIVIVSAPSLSKIIFALTSSKRNTDVKIEHNKGIEHLKVIKGAWPQKFAYTKYYIEHAIFTLLQSL